MSNCKPNSCSRRQDQPDLQIDTVSIKTARIDIIFSLFLRRLKHLKKLSWYNYYWLHTSYLNMQMSTFVDDNIKALISATIL